LIEDLEDLRTSFWIAVLLIILKIVEEVQNALKNKLYYIRAINILQIKQLYSVKQHRSAQNCRQSS